jgi:peptide deformylase
VQALIDDMFETMYEYHGIGLAAVQVGEPVNLFIINAAQDPEKEIKGKEEVFMNPRILKRYGKEEEFEEGCLCLPGIRENVKRRPLIDVEYLDRAGKKMAETGVDGLRARVIQHEYDHLQGVLFVERLSPTRRLLLRRELKRVVEEYS